jgi:predicted XRE-type DNA-binding protein
MITSIKNLMETLGLSQEQAMAALKVPENEREKYAKLLG